MNKTRTLWGLGFAFVFLVAGIATHLSGVGERPYLGFSSAGAWLIYIGMVSLVMTLLRGMRKRKRLVDERMELVAFKSARVALVGFMLLAFAIMVADGFIDFAVSYGMLMAELVCAVLIVYMVSYHALLRRH
ncbi:hypothetical protein COY28_04840 [Candidatus Woesearchaeota archaeon CG_4_10_14_0_2_um_filter_57_5]|nr:MAG: hypothetical protein AUJ68_06130 [Candidatus Woesearchaeota archaeon CG1_02_57_44]PIN69143.1 MAG: hypothetical protein COV94_03250 [Candidatus Woesearchaeota archaeon CG11_big_fil_rev_8_21_14_0_20_57_5]PIZ51712.1 MAG: hypothetical protein COY28_04840 [Candidatus Woesearchaeota archaeon CG_4_10_14_0_2_um_filter_57_5]